MDTDLDSTFEGIYSCTMQENPRQFITEVITDLFFENQTKQEIFYDVQGLYPGKFPNEEIDQIIKTVFESNTSEQTDFHLTDVGNSERFIKEHGNNLLFCSGIKTKSSWFMWTGKVWKEVGEDSLMGYATKTAKKLYAEAALPNAPPGLGKWAVSSESHKGRQYMIRGAGFHVEFDRADFDTKGYLLNLENGTYDLEQFILKKHEREDHLTKKTSLEFNEEKICPFWEDHLLTVFNGDVDTVRYFQEICGYSLLQYNPEQVMFILWGEGKNGKSETMKVLRKIHGEYGVNIESESLASSRKNTEARPRPDIVRLKGARLVTVTEPDKDVYLSEGLVKTFTGDDTMTARGLHQDQIEFKPGGKIFLATNHNPKFSAGGNGIYRRVKKIPFTVEIPENKRKADYGDFLFDNEGAGIFNWMLEGLKRYRDRGKLLESSSVTNATLNFRMESSPIGDFLIQDCVLTLNPDDILGRADITDKYTMFCDEWGIPVEKRVSQKRIAYFLQALGVVNGPKVHGYRSWKGLRFKTPEEREREEQTGERQTIL